MEFFFSVFILDSGKHCFVWIGKGASEGEKKNGFCRAHVSFDTGSLHNDLLTTPMVVLTQAHHANVSFDTGSLHNDLLTTPMVVLSQAHHANVSFVTASPLSFDLLDCVQ